MMLAAMRASGTPVDLDENGTVRLALGLSSITKSLPLCTAYCTLSAPTTWQASASLCVVSRISSTMESASE